MNVGKPVIEGPYGTVLSKMMYEMVRKDYPLNEIESYITNIEKFLTLIASPNMDISDVKMYLTRTISSTSVEALHFFFREVLASLPQETGYPERPADRNLNLQEDSLYQVLTV